MDFDKIKSAALPALPEELDDKHLIKSHSAIEKAHKSFKKSASDFLKEADEMNKVTGKLVTEMTALKFGANRKKQVAAQKFINDLNTYRDGVRGK